MRVAKPEMEVPCYGGMAGMAGMANVWPMYLGNFSLLFHLVEFRPLGCMKPVSTCQVDTCSLSQ